MAAKTQAPEPNPFLEALDLANTASTVFDIGSAIHGLATGTETVGSLIGSAFGSPFGGAALPSIGNIPVLGSLFGGGASAGAAEAAALGLGSNAVPGVSAASAGMGAFATFALPAAIVLIGMQLSARDQGRTGGQAQISIDDGAVRFRDVASKGLSDDIVQAFTLGGLQPVLQAVEDVGGSFASPDIAGTFGIFGHRDMGVANSFFVDVPGIDRITGLPTPEAAAQTFGLALAATGGISVPDQAAFADALANRFEDFSIADFLETGGMDQLRGAVETGNPKLGGIRPPSAPALPEAFRKSIEGKTGGPAAAAPILAERLDRITPQPQPAAPNTFGPRLDQQEVETFFGLDVREDLRGKLGFSGPQPFTPPQLTGSAIPAPAPVAAVPPPVLPPLPTVPAPQDPADAGTPATGTPTPGQDAVTPAASRRRAGFLASIRTSPLGIDFSPGDLFRPALVPQRATLG